MVVDGSAHASATLAAPVHGSRDRPGEKILRSFDVLIVGSGLAGLTAALNLADRRDVAVLTKRKLPDGASSWAQGGIAAVLSDDDSTDDHIKDTLIAGAGLCDEEVTRFVIENAKEAIDWLIDL